MTVAMALAPPVNSYSNAIASDGLLGILSQMRGGLTMLTGVLSHIHGCERPGIVPKILEASWGISVHMVRRPRCCQRGFEKNPMGSRKMHVQVVQVPARKDANIQ